MEHLTGLIDCLYRIIFDQHTTNIKIEWFEDRLNDLKTDWMIVWLIEWMNEWMNELMTELLNELINQLMNSEHLCMYATELYDTV